MALLDKVFGTQNRVQEVFSPASAFAAIPPVSSAIALAEESI